MSLPPDVYVALAWVRRSNSSSTARKLACSAPDQVAITSTVRPDRLPRIGSTATGVAEVQPLTEITTTATTAVNGVDRATRAVSPLYPRGTSARTGCVTQPMGS